MVAECTVYLMIAATLWYGSRAYCPPGVKVSIALAVITLFWPVWVLLYLFLLYAGRDR